MEIEQYIESGILEAYVLGSACDADVRELLYLKRKYPQIDDALSALEADLERIAQNMAIAPPPDSFEKIEDCINELAIKRETDLLKIDAYSGRSDSDSSTGKKSQYIEVEAESSYMRLHKSWRWIFALIFLLGKIFLACAIYFYLANRQAQQQIQELKTGARQEQQR